MVLEKATRSCEVMAPNLAAPTSCLDLGLEALGRSRAAKLGDRGVRALLCSKLIAAKLQHVGILKNAFEDSGGLGIVQTSPALKDPYCSGDTQILPRQYPRIMRYVRSQNVLR